MKVKATGGAEIDTVHKPRGRHRRDHVFCLEWSKCKYLTQMVKNKLLNRLLG